MVGWKCAEHGASAIVEASHWECGAKDLVCRLLLEKKKMASTIESNKANLLSRFLTIRDDYQRALDMIKKNKDLDEVFLNGLERILKKLENMLQAEGVIPIETIGKIIDSNKHDVISFSYKDDLPENTITKEIREGYTLNDKALKPSRGEI